MTEYQRQSYDIIGDIHGEYLALVSLLKKLGYQEINGIWQSSERKVIFLGDFIDRGKFQQQVLDLVMPMVEHGYAHAVMGNHEYNAVAYFTEGEEGEYLRPHTPKNCEQHKAFLDVYESRLDEWSKVISWFKTLPLWLDMEGLRVVHACWDKVLIEKLEDQYKGSLLTEELLQASCKKGSWEFSAIETLLKGKEIPLPEGSEGFCDKDGTLRHHIRVKWWDGQSTTYHRAVIGASLDELTHIPDDSIPGDHLVVYGHEEKPVFLGHYWLDGEPEPLASNIACIDYSVAKHGGKLVAYRWDGECALSADKYIW